MNKKVTTFEITSTALMCAILCVLAPVSIPLPGLVPISLATMIVYFIGYILGVRYGTLCVMLYIFLGAIGLPVFSGFSGGLQKLAGPTGGYIITYIFMAFLVGIFVSKFKDNVIVLVFSMLLGMLFNYVGGTIWFVYVTKMSVKAAIAVCILPFFVLDLVKIGIVALIGPVIRKRLVRAGYLKKY